MTLKKLDKLSTVVVVSTVLLLNSCKPSSEQKVVVSEEQTQKEQTQKNQGFESLFDSTSKSIPVFYNMNLTVDMNSLFEENQVAYNKALLNPSENVENYLTSYKKALNIGVYAVDLSYVKLFEEFDQAGKYFSAMHKLSESLGIPDDFFYGAAKRFEKNISNTDSLAYIANEVYNITDNYLKENNRENTAALVIVGGWVEAINLAIQISEQAKDKNTILDKIGDQKNSIMQVANLVDLKADNNEYIVGIVNDIKALLPDFKTLSEVYQNEQKADLVIASLKQKVSAIRSEITK